MERMSITCCACMPGITDSAPLMPDVKPRGMHVADHIKMRFTLGVGLVLLHYAVWRCAILLIHYVPNVEGFAANLLFTTVAARWYVVAAVCAYSLLRRFALQKHQSDLYGPPLAVLSAGTMYLEALKYAN